MLFHLFGDGSTVAPDSTGYGFVNWWDQGGREIVVGVGAFAVLLAGRVHPLTAAGFALLSGLATLGWQVVWLFVFVLTGGSLD